MAIKIVQFLAIVLTALSLVPGGAHLLELPNKIQLDREQYYTVQLIYRGWVLAAIPLLGALIATFALAMLSRTQQTSMLLAAGAFLLLATTLVTFFLWVFPANQATDNWTVAPDNWRALRTQWETVHAVNAVLTLGALIAATLASLAWSDR